MTRWRKNHKQLDSAMVARFYLPEEREDLRRMARELVEQLATDFGRLRNENPQAAALLLKSLRDKKPADAVH